LAGSEKVNQTRGTGGRFKEGCAINTSLSTLTKVIDQLRKNERYIFWLGLKSCCIFSLFNQFSLFKYVYPLFKKKGKTSVGLSQYIFKIKVLIRAYARFKIYLN